MQIITLEKVQAATPQPRMFAFSVCGVSAGSWVQKRKDCVRQEVTQSLLILISPTVATETHSCHSNRFRCEWSRVAARLRALWFCVIVLLQWRCVLPLVPHRLTRAGIRKSLEWFRSIWHFCFSWAAFFFTPEMLSRICKFGKSGHLRGKEHILGEQSTKYEMWGHMSFLCFSHCVAGGKHMWDHIGKFDI